MRELLRRLWVAIREFAAAPLDWNGFEMLVLLVFALALFALAMFVAGVVGSG